MILGLVCRVLFLEHVLWSWAPRDEGITVVMVVSKDKLEFVLTCYAKGTHEINPPGGGGSWGKGRNVLETQFMSLELNILMGLEEDAKPHVQEEEYHIYLTESVCT